MKKTGQILKEKREAAGLSISEVALATKINPKVLIAIEEGDEEHLPAKTFLKGFVRSYASFLKIDVEGLIAVFHEEIGAPQISASEQRQELNRSETSSRRGVEEESSKGMRIAAVVVIVVLIGLIIGVRELIEKYQKEKVVVAPTAKLSPLDQPSPVAPASVDSAKPAVENSAATPAKPEDKAKSADVKADTKTVNAKAEPAKPAETPAAAAKDEPKKEEAKAAAPAPVTAEKKEEPKKEESQAAEQKPESAKPAKKVRNEIILEALDKVDVKLNIDGQTKKVSLAPTQVHTIYANQPVVLNFSDGGAVNVILNGHEKGVPGDLGKPKQIKIP